MHGKEYVNTQNEKQNHAAQHLKKQCLSPRQQEMPDYIADESRGRKCAALEKNSQHTNSPEAPSLVHNNIRHRLKLQ